MKFAYFTNIYSKILNFELGGIKNFGKLSEFAKGCSALILNFEL